MRKDESLNQLAEKSNVAQFVAFSPCNTKDNIEITYNRILTYPANFNFAHPDEAVAELLAHSKDGLVNVRSFTLTKTQGNPFIYGLADIDVVLEHVYTLAKQGYYTIVNETIDIHDGGVSGVIWGKVMEFAPDATPRCVESPGVVKTTTSKGLDLLSSVYGSHIVFPDLEANDRLEFSLHPKPCGYKNTNILGWELSKEPHNILPSIEVWPNNFSKFLGDKVYGLLVAHINGIKVPRTMVFHRRIAPFTFGENTGDYETWLRTAPNVQAPGKFTTICGWVDPFKVMSKEDPTGDVIPSILVQQGVRAYYSGAAILGADNKTIIEGKKGKGDTFMQGSAAPEEIPPRIRSDVDAVFERMIGKLGAVRFEWVHDGDEVWIVQLHQGATKSSRDILVPGEAVSWHEFDISNGLEALRDLISGLSPEIDGVLLKGDVGLTSHIADVIRKSGIVAKLDIER